MNIILKLLNFNLNSINKYKIFFYKFILAIFFFIILYIFFLCYGLTCYNSFFIIFQSNKFLLLEKNFFYLNFNYYLEIFISFFWGIICIISTEFIVYINYIKYIFLIDLNDFSQKNISTTYLNYLYTIICPYINDFFKTSFLKYIEYISIISLQLFLLFLSIWTRACGPRVRLDQLSNLTWKELLITLIVILINIFLIMFFI